FYLLFPLLVLLRPRVRNAALLVIGGLGVALILFFGEPVYRNVFYYLAFFAIGMWAEEKRWLPGRRLALLGSAIAAGCVALCLALPQPRGLLIAPAHITGSAHRWTYLANCLLAF